MANVMPAGAASDIISVDEAARRYPGRWILMHVKRVDERQTPAAGSVLHASRSRRAIAKALAALATDDPARRPYYIFHAPPQAGLLIGTLGRLAGLVEASPRNGR